VSQITRSRFGSGIRGKTMSHMTRSRFGLAIKEKTFECMSERVP
jgi:hypothetical protein